jgi:hypothetical protein
MVNSSRAVPSKAVAARRLARTHSRVDGGILKAFHITGAHEDDPAEPLKLLEVSRNTPANGVVPVFFGAEPDTGIPYSSVIVEITPDEFKQLKRGALRLPNDWRLGDEINLKQV